MVILAALHSELSCCGCSDVVSFKVFFFFFYSNNLLHSQTVLCIKKSTKVIVLHCKNVNYMQHCNCYRFKQVHCKITVSYMQIQLPLSFNRTVLYSVPHCYTLFFGL